MDDERPQARPGAGPAELGQFPCRPALEAPGARVAAEDLQGRAAPLQRAGDGIAQSARDGDVEADAARCAERI